MTISEIELDNLTSRYPSEGDAIGRLRDLIAKQQSKGDAVSAVYSMARLVSLAQPQSSWNFAHILAELSTSGVLEQKLRLRSSSGVGIGDFGSYDEVPEIIHDITIDQEVEVDPEDLEVIYKIPQDA